MTVTDAGLLSLAASHDIISIGMLADEARRTRHGLRTTFVRVADVTAGPSEPFAIPPAAGEIRIVGAPETRSAAIARVDQILASAGRVPVSAFSLADLEELAIREHVTLRSFLEELNIAGLALARLTIDRLPETDPPSLLKEVSALQRDVAVVRAFAPLPRRVNPPAPPTGYE